MNYSGFDLDGKRALVFGGTSGIGKSIALALADAGADVVAIGRGIKEVAKTTREIRAMGKRSLEIAADVTRRSEVQAAVDTMLQEMATIDILVNSAGTTKRVASFDLEDRDFNHILDVNLKGTWYASQIVGRIMRRQMYGRIINIGSVASFLSAHEVVAYSASKAAVVMLSRCLAAEWAPYNITVNVIAPGFFETPMNHHLLNEPKRKASILSHTPMKRFGNLDEIKGAAVYLASDAASYVTGETLSVDGGFLIQGVGP
jgi:NAD(P)-dependent dehydrogenase (short-subunit alcohol dehydrogenase family)